MYNNCVYLVNEFVQNCVINLFFFYRPFCLRCIKEVAKHDWQTLKAEKYSTRNYLINLCGEPGPSKLLVTPIPRALNVNSFHTLSRVTLQNGLNISPSYLGRESQFLCQGMSTLGLLGRITKRLVKIRYLVLGSAVGGGVALQQVNRIVKKASV